MFQSSSGLVLGYHGCERAIGENILSGQTHLEPSRNEYDWLGNGRYFWEGDPQRAEEFAIEKRLKEPFVIGAVFDLGFCLNLANRQNIAVLKNAYDQLVTACVTRHGPLPKNKTGKKKSDDYKLRFLDCAVIEMIHTIREESNRKPYDSVRGIFWEGPDVYPGAGFRTHNHVQICVRNPNCIKGYFRPLTEDPAFEKPEEVD